MKRLLTAIFIIAAAESASAQEDLRKQYEAFRQQAQQEYGDFRSKANAEYAEFMRKAWEEYKAEPARTAPVKPKPPVQPQAAPDTAPQTRELPYSDIVRPAPAAPQPQPLSPIVQPAPSARPTTAPTAEQPTVAPNTKPVTADIPASEQPTAPTTQPTVAPSTLPTAVPPTAEPFVKPNPSATPSTVHPSASGLREVPFDFYGTYCIIRADNRANPRLANASEASVSRMWTELSGGNCDAAVADCLQLRTTLALCDWGYLQLVGKFAEMCYDGHCNESVVMQTYIMAQSGYKVRLARSGDKLTMLLPSKNEIWSYSFLRIGDCKYYILDKSLRGKGFQLCDVPFPGEKFVSLYMRTQPRLSVEPVDERQFRSKRYPQLAATFAPNRRLIEFYNDYPLCNDWDMYAQASLSEELKAALYPTLRKEVAGKSKQEAADMLINFVQTAFNYKTDPEQFGYERPLFGDETFHYPYSDCEDRAILYSTLVRELLGLDAALVSYPDHLATAVCFGSEAKGDYITVDGRRYTICDPTYIGASTGMTMPDMDNARATVILLK